MQPKIAIESFEPIYQYGVKGILIMANILTVMYLQIQNNIDDYEKGGIIALFAGATWVLWKLVQKKDKMINKSFEDRLADKDKQIEELQAQLKEK